ncbi:MAG: hypothetical protein ACI4RA_03065 [Kiritimatiellia bacterium]
MENDIGALLVVIGGILVFPICIFISILPWLALFRLWRALPRIEKRLDAIAKSLEQIA